MKNILLEWRGLGYLNKYQAEVSIYDKNGFLFTATTYNGQLEVCLEKDKIYKVIAISPNEILQSIFYLDKCRNKYIFYFSNSIYRPLIIFHLTDFYYKNLPIEKGEITFV